MPMLAKKCLDDEAQIGTEYLTLSKVNKEATKALMGVA